jgi:hypothetical protein
MNYNRARLLTCDSVGIGAKLFTIAHKMTITTGAPKQQKIVTEVKVK